MAPVSAEVNKLYYVEWDDPASEHKGWFDLTDEELNKLVPGKCASVGWAIKVTEEYITIASTLMLCEKQASCDTTLPKAVITKLQEISIG